MIKFIEELEGLISNKIAMLVSIYSLIKLEATLAGMSIIPLILNLFFIVIILITIWFSSMLFLGYYLFLSFSSISLAASSIIILNLIVLFIFYRMLMYNLNNMSFPKTRAYFSKKQDYENEQLEKTADKANSSAGQAIEVPEK